MERAEAQAWVKKNGALPEPPALAERTCRHIGTDRPCSCHLTPIEHGVAQSLGTVTLYLFGQPYRGRPKVPYYPSEAA